MPKTQPDAPEPTVTLTHAQVSAMIADALSKQATATNVPAAPAFDIDAFAEASAKANQKINKRENETHPAVSAYSYREGDVAKPRPVMRCPTFWYGQEVKGDVDTAEEMELINQLMPGVYLCSQPDGNTLPVTVAAEYAVGGTRPTKIQITFKPETGRDVLSRVLWCREMIAQAAARQPVLA